MSQADEMFEKLDYIKIHCEEGFFIEAGLVKKESDS